MVLGRGVADVSANYEKGNRRTVEFAWTLDMVEPHFENFPENSVEF